LDPGILPISPYQTITAGQVLPTRYYTTTALYRPRPMLLVCGAFFERRVDVSETVRVWKSTLAKAKARENKFHCMSILLAQAIMGFPSEHERVFVIRKAHTGVTPVPPCLLYYVSPHIYLKPLCTGHGDL
jgi:hypothetical protein